MPKEDDINVSSNGASSNGASPYPPVTPAERESLDRIHEGYDELRQKLKAEGFDGTEEYEKLRARAATWSQ
jgi:hypothetical protein